MKRTRGAIGRRVLQIAAVCGKRDIRVCFWEQFFMSGPKYFTAYQFAATDVKSGKRHAIGTASPERSGTARSSWARHHE
jgi:hypothetical protein